MPPTTKSWPLLLASLATLAPAQPDVYTGDRAFHPARVEILAISSSVHLAYAGAQETYVAKLLGPGRKDEARLVLLQDRYPEYGKPILRSLLREHALLHMELRQNDSCSRRASDIALHARTSEVFDPDLRGILEERADDPVPVTCFDINHGATHTTH